VRRSVYRTASFSVCSRRRTELPIIYADFRLDYKLATLPIECRSLASGGHQEKTSSLFWPAASEVRGACSMAESAAIAMTGVQWCISKNIRSRCLCPYGNITNGKG